MAIVTTSKKFKATDLYNWDGGITYFNGVVGQKTIFEWEFYFEKTALKKWLQFDSASKTITNYNRLDNTSFLINSQFKVGETLMFTDTVSNPGQFTITAVTDRVITVSEAVTDEIAEAASIFMNKKLTAMDFYYNIKNIPESQRRINTAPATVTDRTNNFLSLTDSDNLQKYQILKGIDASDTSTEVFFNIGTDSYAWVTDILTGAVSQCKIVGTGISDDYKQGFKIMHTFLQTPLSTKQLYQNFLNKNIPTNFLNNSAPQYIYGIDGKYNGESFEPAISFTDLSTPSCASWFNQNNQRTRPEYYFSSIAYADHADASYLSKIDYNKEVDVTIVVKSLSGLFEADGTFILGFIYCSQTESNYKNNPRTLRQNTINDRAVLSVGTGAINGEYFGTDYGLITNAQVVHTDDSTATITFRTKFSNNAKAEIKSLSTSDLNYAISVITQNPDTASSDFVDTVNILCDFQNGDYNLSEANLLYLKDYVHINKFPAVSSANQANSVNGYEGDIFYADVPFQIETATIQPIIKSAGMQIVAVKDNKSDFILEETILNTSQTCAFGKVQQLNISKTRNYKTYPGSPYNEILLQNNSSYDSGTKKGYLFRYPFVLRYDYWAELYQANISNCPDIQSDVKNVNNRWVNITDGGWNLKLRFVSEVIGTNGVITTYQCDTPITINKINTPPDTGQEFIPQIYLLDENNNRVNAIIKGGITKVCALFTGDFTNFPDFGELVDAVSGTISIDVTNKKGGIINRRTANTDNISEADSPWSAPSEGEENADNSYTNGNSRINFFYDSGNPSAVVITSLFNDKSANVFGNLSDLNPCADGNGDGTIPSGGLGTPTGAIFTGTLTPILLDERLWDDLEIHLWDDLEQATW